MEFRLTYNGPLKANNEGERGKTPGRKDYKHRIRQGFHRQLKHLYEITPFLSTGTHSGKGLEGVYETELPRYDKESIAARHCHFGFNFLPLVTSELKLGCSLDVLMLGRKAKGQVWQNGDIDNRLKTLFDCLQIPNAHQGYESFTPKDDEKPFYCLLENDRLISKITVETDDMLEDLPRAEDEDPDETDARVVITVRLRPYEVNLENILFS